MITIIKGWDFISTFYFHIYDNLNANVTEQDKEKLYEKHDENIT